MTVQDWLKRVRHINLGTLTEFLPHSGLDTVAWLEFLKQSQVVVKVSTQSRLQSQWQGDIQNLLPALWSHDDNPDFVGRDDWSKLDPEVRRFWGEKVLELYFRGVLKWQKTNLDFKPETFKFSPHIEKPIAHWHLSRFFIGFDPQFSKSLKLLYQGYYEQRPLDLREGLIQMNFLGREQDSSTIEGLLASYFGSATDKPSTFSIDQYRKSFLDLYNYLRLNHRKIPANFVWLGIILAGMCETLQELGVDYQVREAYRRAVQN